MIEFKDLDGDCVETMMHEDGHLIVQCLGASDAWNAGEHTAIALDKDMARTLAADLLEFANTGG